MTAFCFLWIQDVAFVLTVTLNATLGKASDRRVKKTLYNFTDDGAQMVCNTTRSPWDDVFSSSQPLSEVQSVSANELLIVFLLHMQRTNHLLH